MTQPRFVWPAIAVLVVLVAAFSIERTQDVQAWEYGVLQVQTTTPGNALTYWKTADVNVSTSGSAVDLASQMGCPVSDPMRYDVFSIYSCTGARGWEFVWIDRDEGLMTHVFKRPAP